MTNDVAEQDLPSGPPENALTETSTPARRGPGRAWLAVALAVGCIAFVARLVPVLRGGGLFGLGVYDDGVYFAAAVGLAHGVVPYRDFLFLHPPGIVLILWPFAVLGRAIGSADAFAVARVGFMLLGTANAVLVARAVRRIALPGAVAGGLCYALAPAAVLIGHSTLLETPQTTCMLLAVLLVTAGPTRRLSRGPWWSGLLLGVGAGIKIWGVVVCAAVLLWAWQSLGGRRALRLGIGAVLGAAAVCLPFLALAGPVMWRMVVLDQLARERTAAGVPQRVSDILGLTGWQPGLQGWSVMTVLAAATALVCIAVACWCALGRLSVILLVATTGLLLAVPSWFANYPGLSAAPLALVVGSASGVVWRGHRSWGRAVAAALVVAVVAVWGAPSTTTTFGRTFPAGPLATAAPAGTGCVTSDDPTTLVELGAMDRNLRGRCPFVVDLGGYSYDLRTPGGSPLTRRQNAAWQQEALDYLGSGTATLVVRFSHAFGFTARSARVVGSWPVVGEVHGYTVQRPPTDPLGALRREPKPGH